MSHSDNLHAGELVVGFIGLGAMGLPMAKTLLGAGIKVHAFDVRAEAVAALEDAGGRGAATAADAVADAGLIVIVVVNAAQVEDVLFGRGAVAAAAQPGTTVVVCSTVSPEFARSTSERLAAHDLLMLDSPISGGTTGATAGTLSIMASGPDAAFAAARPALEAMGENIYNMGDDIGLGSMMKLVNQLLAGSNLAVACEAMAYGARAGLDPAKVYEVITNSAGNSWMFGNRMPHVLAGDYTPHSAVDIWLKDLTLVLDAGRDLKFPLVMAASALQLFTMASGAGYGRLDDSAVVKVFEEILGYRVKSES